MDEHELREQLLRVAAELQNIAEKLTKPSASAKPAERTHCPVCNELLDNGTRIVRGVHSKCQKRLERQGAIGEAELAGILLPKGKSGRKSIIDVNRVLESAKTAKDLIGPAAEKIKQHRQKTKP